MTKMAPMKDTLMDLNPDSLCVPTMWGLDMFPDEPTLALAWKSHIEFELENFDPNDVASIY